jgi:hypothetical protein
MKGSYYLIDLERRWSAGYATIAIAFIYIVVCRYRLCEYIIIDKR